MRNSKRSLGASPAISSTLLLAIVVAGFVLVSVSSFEFFRAMIDEEADVELDFEEEGDNKIIITLLENQNADFVDIVMANGDTYKFDNEGESKKITIEQSGNIKAIAKVSDTGSRQMVRSYSPRNIRAIEGNVSYNPPAEDVTVKIERSGRVIVTQETDENGDFGLVPSSDGSYDIHVEQTEDVKTLIPPGTKNIEIDLGQDVIGKTQSSSDTIADLLMEGSGIRDNPYEIENPSDIQATRTDKDAYYIIREDIDASVTQNSDWDPGFDSIGEDSNRFNGTVEVPNPVQIDGLRMNNTGNAVFENITGTATIEDDNVDVTDPNGGSVDFVANAILNWDFPSSVVEDRKVRGSVTVGDSGDLTVEIPGVDKQTKTVNLDGQTEKTVNFNLDTENRDRGSYNINIQMDKDSKKDSIDIILPEAANEPVVANFNVPKYVSTDKSSFDVEAEILNAGDTNLTGESVTIDPGAIEANSVTKNLNDLEPNESQVVTETFQIQSTDELQEYQMSVSGTNLNAKDTYNLVTTPAGIIINSTEVLNSYSEGEYVKTQNKIRNTGNSPSSDTIKFSISSLSISKSVRLQLDPGETKNVRLGINTDLGNTGTFSYTVSSSSDSIDDSIGISSIDTGGIATTLKKPKTKRNYTVGNSVDPTVTVRNDGSSDTTPELAVNIRNSTGIVDSYSPSTSPLSPGESTTYSTSFGTSNYETGNYTLVTKTQDDQFEVPINIVGDNGVQVKNVNILNTNDEVKRNGTLRLNVDLENTGIGTPSKSLSVKTSNSESSTSVKYAIKPAFTKTLRVSLPISESESTGTTDVVVSTDTTKRETVTIVD